MLSSVLRSPRAISIPGLGNLFKSRSGSRQKTNLLVFLRPRILRDQSATEATSESKYEEIRNEENSLHKGRITLLPGERQPSIPALPSTRSSPADTPAIPPAAHPAPGGVAAPVPPATPPTS
jgi:general secretion pathway protein D